ncbi:hypothetical protein RJ640_022118 [Escallonia rubra]|uniref:Uncharacterized protein n=1 Tax=Escallonia rubra TaxID=112253 RepID=A0AA88RWD0_9ASTE|nr:hypothetical protein RJ640_022118 [Escallonia rubra]
MAALRHLLRSPTTKTLKSLRSLSTSAPSHHNYHQRNQQYLTPNDYINSWEPPRDPDEAYARLAQLRRDYADKVRQARKGYIEEMELMRIEKRRQDDAKMEALRIANAERKVAKDAAKKARAAERAVEQEQFRQALSKERAEKLELWRMRSKQVEEKKKEKNELVRRKSSIWIDESELEKKILEAIVDTTPL